MSEKIQVKLPDHSTMQVHVFRPQEKPRTGLILLQEAFGVTAHIRRCAERFAQAGHLVVAPELFHRTADPGTEISYGDFEKIKPHTGAITPEGLKVDLQASFDWLKKESVLKFGSVGYCLGGRVSFLANSFLSLNAAVSYYGRIAPEFLDKAPEQKSPVLLYWGGKDKGIPLEAARQVADALKASGKAYTHVEFSEAEHGFNCDDRSSFNPEASEQAWDLTLKFFQKHLS